ncbi:uncharacterized protein LOC110693417 [Chenopodium quinoa]|uniref:uncharacterized protein LOC110693417 n=1 Tax=Chenopodium quinoa TaxID=63459 RepID=UPI000B78CFB0|nr:uncharacterized protein LOC110693417 [Chenopodium quinoa]
MAEDINMIKGLWVTRRSPSISHLFFADDAMVFFHANTDSCTNVVNILERFGDISGQQLNLNKSFVKFSKLEKVEEVEDLKAILSVGQVQVLDRHLGAPIDFTARKMNAFKYFVDKVAAQILSWAALNLSQSVKLILINTVLISIPSHVMKCFKLPASITNRTDSLIARFWWGSRGDKGMQWVKRDIIQRPKGMGGLGIRSMVYLNDTLLFKQVTRMHCNPQLLVAHCIDPIHECPLCMGEPSTCFRGNTSWGRRGLFNVANKVVKGYHWKIGRVKDLISPDTRTWNTTIIRERFEWSIAQEILEMELPSNEEKDDAIADNVFCRIIWKLNIPPKWSLFLWKLVMNGMAVKSNLVKRGIEIEDYCDSCGTTEEDLQHLFRMCSFARYAWKNCSLNILSENDESTPFGQWIQNYIMLYHSEDGKKSERIGMFIGVLWSLWLTRNGRVFSNQGGYLADLFRNYNTAMHNFSVWKTKEEGEDVRKKDNNNNGAPPGFQRINIGSEKEEITYPQMLDWK